MIRFIIKKYWVPLCKLMKFVPAVQCPLLPQLACKIITTIETVLFSGLVQPLMKQCIESGAQNKCLKLNTNNAAMVVLV